MASSLPCLCVTDVDRDLILFVCELFVGVALSFKYIVEQQPIGRELFQQFCDTKQHLKKAIDFLDAVVSSVAAAARMFVTKNAVNEIKVWEL